MYGFNDIQQVVDFDYNVILSWWQLRYPFQPSISC